MPPAEDLRRDRSSDLDDWLPLREYGYDSRALSLLQPDAALSLCMYEGACSVTTMLLGLDGIGLRGRVRRRDWLRRGDDELDDPCDLFEFCDAERVMDEERASGGACETGDCAAEKEGGERDVSDIERISPTGASLLAGESYEPGRESSVGEYPEFGDWACPYGEIGGLGGAAMGICHERLVKRNEGANTCCEDSQ